jgi:AraC family transcriptional activator of tynA and feaB
LERFSTAGLSQADRLPYWNDVALSTIGPLVVDAVDRRRFVASMTRIKLRNCEIVSPTSNAASIQSVAGGERSSVLNLMVQHRGSSTTRTGDLRCALEAGDFMLYDPGLPFELAFSDPTQMIVVRLPLGETEKRLPGLARLAGIAMKGDRGARAVLSGFVRNAWSHLDGDNLGWADSLCEAIWPLVESAYRELRASACHPDPLTKRRQRLLSFIDAHLGETDLDAASVAQELGVSARTIQITFANLGTTPSAYIQSCRVRRAARELERQGTGASVTAIALALGFNDASGFSRAFRREFGIAPRDYRRGRRAAPRSTSLPVK